MKPFLYVLTAFCVAWSAAAAALSSCKREHQERAQARQFALVSGVLLVLSIVCGISACYVR